MKCPKCSTDKLGVVDTRTESDSIRRRRECQECNHRFTTFERIELVLPYVVKKDGRREPFKRDKVYGGVVRSCEKRPVSLEKISELVESIEKKISEMCVSEIQSTVIGDHVMDGLRELDTIAYVRFASVYQEFSDLKQFTQVLRAAKEK